MIPENEIWPAPNHMQSSNLYPAGGAESRTLTLGWVHSFKGLCSMPLTHQVHTVALSCFGASSRTLQRRNTPWNAGKAHSDWPFLLGSFGLWRHLKSLWATPSVSSLPSCGCCLCVTKARQDSFTTGKEFTPEAMAPLHHLPPPHLPLSSWGSPHWSYAPPGTPAREPAEDPLCNSHLHQKSLFCWWQATYV